MKNYTLLALAGFAATLTSCKNPADNVTDAEVSGAKEEATATGGVVYTFSESSKIGFVGSKVTGSHEGGFKDFDGSFTVIDGEPVAGEFTIEMSSTWSDDEKLTQHLMADDFFDVASFPKSTFKATSFEKQGDSTYKLAGNLTLHGVTKNITFPVNFAKTDDSVTLDAKFDINRTDFGISYPGKTDDLIREEVVLTLDLQAKKTMADEA